MSRDAQVACSDPTVAHGQVVASKERAKPYQPLKQPFVGSNRVCLGRMLHKPEWAKPGMETNLVVHPPIRSKRGRIHAVKAVACAEQ